MITLCVLSLMLGGGSEIVNRLVNVQFGTADYDGNDDSDHDLGHDVRPGVRVLHDISSVAICFAANASWNDEVASRLRFRYGVGLYPGELRMPQIRIAPRGLLRYHRDTPKIIAATSLA